MCDTFLSCLTKSGCVCVEGGGILTQPASWGREELCPEASVQGKIIHRCTKFFCLFPGGGGLRDRPYLSKIQSI